MATTINPFSWLRWILVLFSLLPMASAAAEATLEIKKIEGQDYISVDSMKRFYKFDQLTRGDRTITLRDAKVSITLSIGGNECLMNGVKFVFSHPIQSSGDKVYVSRIDLFKLVDPVIRPNLIENAGNFRTVILDPGHGGKDAGATNSLGTEANYNLKVAANVSKQLTAKGFKVIITRTSDIFLSLQERVDIANTVKENAIFISIHFNSSGSSNGGAARGIETFTLSPQGIAHYGSDFKESDIIPRNGNTHDSANIALATAVHGTMLHYLGKNTFDRGIKRARFSVLSGVRHPAILFEGGFMSHPYESRLIQTPEYQNAVANGIVGAINKYRFAVSRVPAAPKN